MIRITKILSSIIKNGIQYIKLSCVGVNDIRTAFATLPFGIDSNPVKDMRGIYCETGISGEKILIGYIHKNAIAEPGEIRIFSSDGSSEKFIIYLKKDGTCELGGNSDNVVKYSPLNTAATKLETDLATELAAIATAITGVGGSYTPGTIKFDISDSKNEKIKTN